MKNLNNMNNKKKQYKYVTIHQWYRYRYADLDFNSLEEDDIEIPRTCFPTHIAPNDIRVSETREDAEKDVAYFMDLYGSTGVKSVTKQLRGFGFDTIWIRTNWRHSDAHGCSIQDLHVINTYIY